MDQHNGSLHSPLGNKSHARMVLSDRQVAFFRLPCEIKDIIYSMVVMTDEPDIPERPTSSDVEEPKGPRGDPSSPPSNGKSPFLGLPAELRRAIFANSIVSKRTVKPRCESDRASASTSEQPPKHNRTSDLMMLCKKVKDEVATTVYQERTFEIHVHEGVWAGGIEVLDAGRQLLQYMSEDFGIESRFVRFGDGDEFGFDRLKKINIIIYPKTNTRAERHTTMNTYFMNEALAHMLERGCEKDSDRITSINISFSSPARTHATQQAAGRLNIMRNEVHWWDPSKAQPLSTEIHGMSDIEIILRPFSILRRVHNVEIKLPPKVNADSKTLEFVEDLKAVMVATTAKPVEFRQDYNFEMRANAIKHNLFDITLADMFGGKGLEIGKLSEKDMRDVEDDDADGTSKHDLSSTEDGDPKRQKAGHSHFGPGDDRVDSGDDSDGSDDGGRTPPPALLKSKGTLQILKETFTLRKGGVEATGAETSTGGPRAPIKTKFCDVDGLDTLDAAFFSRTGPPRPPRFGINAGSQSSTSLNITNQTVTPTPFLHRSYLSSMPSISTHVSAPADARPPSSLRPSTSDPARLGPATATPSALAPSTPAPSAPTTGEVIFDGTHGFHPSNFADDSKDDLEEEINT